MNGKEIISLTHKLENEVIQILKDYSLGFLTHEFGEGNVKFAHAHIMAVRPLYRAFLFETYAREYDRTIVFSIIPKNIVTCILSKVNSVYIGMNTMLDIGPTLSMEMDDEMFNGFLSSLKLRTNYHKAIVASWCQNPYNVDKIITRKKETPPSHRFISGFTNPTADEYVSEDKGGSWDLVRHLWELTYAKEAVMQMARHKKIRLHGY